MSSKPVTSSDLPTYQWEVYQRSALTGQIASALLVVVSTIALAIILTSAVYAPHTAGNVPILATLGCSGGVGFIIFIASSTLHYLAIRNLKQQTEEREKQAQEALQKEAPPRQLQPRIEGPPLLFENPQVTHTFEEEESISDNNHKESFEEEQPPIIIDLWEEPFLPAQSTTLTILYSEHSEEENDLSVKEVVPPEPTPSTPSAKKLIAHIKDVLLAPTLQALSQAIYSVVVAHHCKTKQETVGEDVLEAIRVAFIQIEQLLDVVMENHKIYVTELLSFYGRGKTEPSVALRRWVAAHNSGDPGKIAETKAQYEAILRGNDFSPIAQALTTIEDNAQMMEAFPTLLESHFSFPDRTLQAIGQDVLKQIFTKTKNHPQVLKALNVLRGQKHHKREEFVRNVETFIACVHEHANLRVDEYQIYNDQLSHYMMQQQFTKSICLVFNMIARNIRLLGFLFKMESDKDQVAQTLAQLDEAFLFSESGDCITLERQELQKEIFALQCQLNKKCKPHERVALIVLPKNEKHAEDFSAAEWKSLVAHHDLVKKCCDANQHNPKTLIKLTNESAVKSLGQKHGVRLIALPVSVSDHPFKYFKTNAMIQGVLKQLNAKGLWGQLVNKGADMMVDVIKGDLSKEITPEVLRALPKMNATQEKMLTQIIDTLIQVMIYPIIDGALRKTSFSTPFQNVVLQQGQELADQLEGLVNSADLSFEEIGNTWQTAFNNLSEAFKSHTTT